MASFSPDCRTYRDIPCRIRLSIASLLKISAFRKPRSLPTILAGSFSSSRLYFPHSCLKSNNRCEASAGNRPRRLQAPELVSSVLCSASSDIETDVSDNRRTFCSNVGTSAFSSASTPAQRASAASMQPPQLENLRCDPAALPAHQSRTPSADKSAPWRCGRFPVPPQAAAKQIDSQLPTEPALRRG